MEHLINWVIYRARWALVVVIVIGVLIGLLIALYLALSVVGSMMP